MSSINLDFFLFFLMGGTMNSVELVKQICKERKIPISRLEKDCGFSNGYIRKLQEGKFPSDRLLVISKYLNLPVDYLMTGQTETENAEPTLTPKDDRDIAKRLEDTLADLESNQEALMFSGEPLDNETRELLKASIENSIRIAKINAKQKFTPKKYRKEQ